MSRPGKADCKLPRPHQLRKSAFGEAFADASSARYKLFLADTLAAAIGDLANASKAISGGKLFTMSYFGYDLPTPESNMSASSYVILVYRKIKITKESLNLSCSNSFYRILIS